MIFGSAMLAALMLPPAWHPAWANKPVPSYTLNIEGSMVQLTADGVPLNKILESLASQSGLKLKATDQATELVYCHLVNETIPEILKKLLRNWSFTLIYKGDNNKGSSPDTLWIINRNSGTKANDPLHLISMDDPALPSQTTPQKNFEKDTITRMFADPQKVLAGFSAKKHTSTEQSTGIQITKISADSPLKEIGVQEEDLIVDVNGQPVSTAAEFVQALTTATKNAVPTIRIDRRHNGMVDPVYLEPH